MPEAFTYFDMRRRIANAIPDEQSFGLEVYTENGRTRTTDQELSRLTGTAKAKAKAHQPELFEPDIEATFPGLGALPVHIKDNPIKLAGSAVESHGKSLGIPLGDGHWMRIHLYLHGHVVLMKSTELKRIKEGWKTIPRQPPFIQLALVNTDSTKSSIAVVDRNLLVRITFLCTPVDKPGLWRDERLGPCPITESEAFLTHCASYNPRNKATPIYKSMRSAQTHFNGIGTSHACEILHLAMIHPAEPVGNIYGSNTIKSTFLSAIKKFFASVTSPIAKSDYLQFVPSGSSGGSAFYECAYISSYINARFLKVYRHTQSSTLITKEHYTSLLETGQLDTNRYPPIGTRKRNRKECDSQVLHKRVQVYCIQMKDGAYAYTVIFKSPDNAQVRYLSEKDARLKAVGEGFAEIGIASFMDTWRIAQEEKTSFAKRLPLREGKRGRPRKTKRRAEERELHGAPYKDRRDGSIPNSEEYHAIDRHLLEETLSGLVAAEIKAGEPFDELFDNDDFE